MYTAYAHLQGIYVLSQSEQNPHTSRSLCSELKYHIWEHADYVPTVHLNKSYPCRAPLYPKATRTVISSCLTQPWLHMLAPYILSLSLHILPHKLSPMSQTCLWPTEQTWHEAVHVMTGSEPITQPSLKHTSGHLCLAGREVLAQARAEPSSHLPQVNITESLPADSPAEPSGRSCCQIAWMWLLDWKATEDLEMRDNLSLEAFVP